MLEELTRATPRKVMFVTRNHALCLQVIRWTYERLKNMGDEQTKALLEENLFVWYAVSWSRVYAL